MSSENLKQVLESVDIKRFDQIIPARRKVIGQAPADMPKSGDNYNTNKVAQALHPVSQEMTVTEIKDLPGARMFRLKCSSGNPAPFAAGQYISVEAVIGSTVTARPYAISSSPADVSDGFYEITVKRVKGGFVSDYILDNWKTGTSVTCSAPEGELYYEPLRDSRYVVGLAGGSGITPFLSMARAIRDGVEGFDLTLLYGCRREEEILYREELDELAKTVSSFKVVYVLSDENKEGFENGFLSAELIKKYQPSDDFTMFICGPAAMYSYEKVEVAKLGLPRRRVRYEAAGTPAKPDGTSVTYTITVDLPGSRVKIPAKSDETILTALERAGIKAKNRCRSGECGWCRTRLKSGDIYAPESAESRRSSDVEYGYIHPCATYPKSDLHILVDTDTGEVKREVKNMKKKERLVSIIMSIIMSLVMGLLAAFVIRKGSTEQALATMPPAPVMYITNALESVTIGVLLVLILPLGKWGKGLASKAHANPPGMKFTLLNCLPVSVISAIVCSCAVCFINVAIAHSKIPAAANPPPLMAMFMGNWLKLLLPSILVSYILSVLISPFVVQAVGLGGPPTGGDVPRD